MRAAKSIAAALILAVLPMAHPSAAATVCADPAPGGDWPRYGNTPDNARSQIEEDRIGPGNADDVVTAWTSSPVATGMSGTFSNTPIVVDGCVYVATSTGWVAALNADSGAVVWQTGPLPGDGVAWHANVISGSPAVTEDTVYVAVNRTGSPYLAALSRADGSLLWTRVIVDRPSGTVVATPVYHEGLIFQGFSGFEFEEDARGGYAIIDASPACSGTSATTCAAPTDGAAGGSLLVHRYTIPDDDYDRGFRGAGIWCTAAVDVETGHAYACTSNPASEREHRYNNSLLKIDLDPSRATFGEIVAAYKGTPDNYMPGLERQPACDEAGWVGQPYYSIPCFQFDLDFGASPHLFTNSHGDKVVGNLQKSGIYHAAYADNMQGAWTTAVGTPCLFWCNASSPATDGTNVYVAGSPGGTVWSLAGDKGHYRWMTPIGNYVHYHPISLANGVAYTVNGVGSLVGFDAGTGAPVLVRSVALEQSRLIAEINSSGVAIARNTIYAATNEFIAAYRLP